MNTKIIYSRTTNRSGWQDTNLASAACDRPGKAAETERCSVAGGRTPISREKPVWQAGIIYIVPLSDGDLKIQSFEFLKRELALARVVEME